MLSHKKTISLLVVFILAVTLFFAGIFATPIKAKPSEQSLIMPKETIIFWYTDDAMTDYISSAAVSFYEDTDIRVVPQKVSGLEYIETIYNSSLYTSDAPDAYIVSNDLLEKAYLAGTACEIKDTNVIVTYVNYPEAALRAVSCRDKIVGYPLSFETGLFLYNKTYLEEYIKEQLSGKAEPNEDGEGETSQETSEKIEIGEEVVLSEEEMNAEIEAILPQSIDEILFFANNYNAPEKMEAIFRWDVTDIFYNYFFIGASTNVGGTNGDDMDYIDIYNADAIRSLRVYQHLNQFFAIDTEEISYEDVLDEFIAGQILYSVVTTDAIEKLEQSKLKGELLYEYGMMEIPMINEEIDSAGMSVTNTVAINGFSENKNAANAFAKYIAFDLAGSLYDRAKKVPASKKVVFENINLKVAAEEYANSIPITKMIEASNYWMQLEIAFTKAWRGEDVNILLKKLSEQILTQVNGEPYVEEMIIIKEQEEEFKEYSED